MVGAEAKYQWLWTWENENGKDGLHRQELWMKMKVIRLSQCRNINGTKGLKNSFDWDPGTGRKEEVGHIGDSTGKFEQQVLGGQVGNTPIQGTDLALSRRMNAHPLIPKEGSMQGVHWVCRDSEKLRECMPVASISSENLVRQSTKKWEEWGFKGGGEGWGSSWVGIGTLGHWDTGWCTDLPHVGEHDFQVTLSLPVGCSPSFEQMTWKECSRTTRFWRRGDLKMNVKAQARLWMKGDEERKKNCREWQQNGRDIYEVKEQLGGQGVPWDNNHKMKSEILVSDFWSRAVTSQDQSCSHGSWWLKLSRDLAHGCNEVPPEPQNVRVTWAGPLFQFPPEELWKHFCQWRIQFWFSATLKSLLYSPMTDTGKNHQNIVKVIILQLK